MKNYRHYKAAIFNYCIASIISVFMMTACDYREIVDLETEYIPVSVNVDWSESLIDIKSTNAFSVWFFPKNGNEPIYTVSNKLDLAEIKVPAGEYSVLIFNETANESDWQSIAFRGTDKYETFEAYARTDIVPNKGGYKSSSNESIINQIEPLAVWRQDYYLVNKNTKSKATISIKPQPLTYKLNIKANFINLNNAYKISGALQTVSQSVFLASGKTGSQTLTQVFSLENNTWNDQDKINGESSATVFSFGRTPDSALKNIIQIDVLTYLGERTNPFVYDVTDAFKSSIGKFSLNISLGYPPNTPITLPKYTEQGVSIGNWDNRDVIMK